MRRENPVTREDPVTRGDPMIGDNPKYNMFFATYYVFILHIMHLSYRLCMHPTYRAFILRITLMHNAFILRIIHLSYV